MKRLELDVLASRSKVWDPNLVCVYIFICCVVVLVTSNEEQFV